MVAQAQTRVLFLCTGNSCRSQMAEGFSRHLKSGEIEAHSAGVNPKGVDPRAVKAMAEVGIDIAAQKSRSIDEVKHLEFDYVITLCDNAQKTCPTFPAKTRVMHVGFEDPPSWRQMQTMKKKPWDTTGGSVTKSKPLLNSYLKLWWKKDREVLATSNSYLKVGLNPF